MTWSELLYNGITQVALLTIVCRVKRGCTKTCCKMIAGAHVRYYISSERGGGGSKK